MLGKRPRPMIGKLTELLVSRGGTMGVLESNGSPRGPFEMKSFGHIGGVGLGIVVALDKSNDNSAPEVLPKHAVFPVYHTKNPHEFDVEEYTYVTCHVPNKTFTKVYYDGAEAEIRRHTYAYDSNVGVGVLRRTTPQPLIEAESSYPTSNFLSSCHLCGNKLHGKDIYMYRGEKAFCSPDCRSSQIMMDERKERCSSEAVEMSSSPYTREQIFSTGILAL